MHLPNPLHAVGKRYVVSLGPVPSIPASEVRPGMLRLYNYGHAHPVVEVREQGGWVYITTEENGKRHTRRHRPGTLIPVEGPTWRSRAGVVVKLRPAVYPRVGQWVLLVKRPGRETETHYAPSWDEAVSTAWQILMDAPVH